MSVTTSLRRLAVGATATAAIVAPALTSTGSVSASSSPAAAQSATSSVSEYTPNDRDKAQNRRLQKQLDAALERAAQDKSSTSGINAAATVYYDDSQAPRFNSLIDQSAAIWNSRVSNVKLVQGTSTNATLRYTEGYGQGSYYYGNGRGGGQIFLDLGQAQQYAPLRITTHETGHALGLPDRYTQPCSKLMSGGGAGTSCTNPYPDSVEASEVNAIWRYGYAGLADLLEAS